MRAVGLALLPCVAILAGALVRRRKAQAMCARLDDLHRLLSSGRRGA